MSRGRLDIYLTRSEFRGVVYYHLHDKEHAQYLIVIIVVSIISIYIKKFTTNRQKKIKELSKIGSAPFFIFLVYQDKKI